jgi:hypothetical protein
MGSARWHAWSADQSHTLLAANKEKVAMHLWVWGLPRTRGELAFWQKTRTFLNMLLLPVPSFKCGFVLY